MDTHFVRDQFHVSNHSIWESFDPLFQVYLPDMVMTDVATLWQF